MTNASVKPALTRIENKLDKIDKIMSELSDKTETRNDWNSSPTVEKLDCKCKNTEVEQEPDQEKRESPQNEDDSDE